MSREKNAIQRKWGGRGVGGVGDEKKEEIISNWNTILKVSLFPRIRICRVVIENSLENARP